MTVIHDNWQELIKPTKLDIDAGEEASRFASITAEPLSGALRPPRKLVTPYFALVTSGSCGHRGSDRWGLA